MNKIIISFLVFILISACSKDENEKPKHRDINGTYQLTLVKRGERITNGSGTYGTEENVTTECDRRTTLKLKSDGSIEQVDFDKETCSNKINRQGFWEFHTNSYDSFIGYLELYSSPIIANSFSLSETGNDTKKITNLRLTSRNITDDETEVSYTLYYERID